MGVMKYSTREKKSEFSLSTVSMSRDEFNFFREFIYDNFGIKLTDVKKTMLESRLHKRLRELGLATFSEYRDLIINAKPFDEEIINLVDVVTTNKTDFFREPAHFNYLTSKALPEVIKARGKLQGLPASRINMWSAGCSTGEEPYTLAMVLSEYAERTPGFTFSIMASDISTKVLKTALKGVYEINKVDPIPLDLKKKYLLRHKDKKRQLVRIAPDLRIKIEFKRINFMDNDYDVDGLMDIIFCRNVLIYFDRRTQEAIINKLARYITPGGFLFLGHSETTSGMSVSLKQVAPTIYRKI